MRSVLIKMILARRKRQSEICRIFISERIPSRFGWVREAAKPMLHCTPFNDFVARYSKPLEDPADVLHWELLEPPPLWFSSVVYPAIVQLMDRPYWRRLWIMQETIVCAPYENIYLGDHRISWRELVLLLKFCMSS